MCESIRVFTVVPTRPSEVLPRSMVHADNRTARPSGVSPVSAFLDTLPGYSGAFRGEGGAGAGRRCGVACGLSRGERRRLLEFDSRISRRT